MPEPAATHWIVGSRRHPAHFDLGCAAELLINQQQHRLPGYEVHVEFVDSRCDVDYPARSDGQILLEFQFNAVCCRGKNDFVVAHILWIVCGLLVLSNLVCCMLVPQVFSQFLLRIFNQ